MFDKVRTPRHRHYSQNNYMALRCEYITDIYTLCLRKLVVPHPFQEYSINDLFYIYPVTRHFLLLEKISIVIHRLSEVPFQLETNFKKRNETHLNTAPIRLSDHH